MSTETRTQLNTDVINNILDGNNRTTAAQVRFVLKNIITSVFNLSDDMALIPPTTTASNGLIKTANNITLGGALTQDTAIDGAFGVNVGETTPINYFQLTSSIINIFRSIEASGVESTLIQMAPTELDLFYTNGDDSTSATIGLSDANISAFFNQGAAGSSWTLNIDGFGIGTNSGGFISFLKADNITTNRTLQLPDNDGTFALLSDIVTLWDDRGNYDASGNVFPSTGGSGASGAILKGDIWTISVAGILGGVSVGVGDTVRALIDTPGTTVGNWAFGESVLNAVTLTGTQTITNKTLTSPKINVGSDATGDIYYRNSGGTLTRLAVGASTTVLGVSGGLPSWVTAALGSVTSVSVVNANGVSGTVATSTTTPAITLTLGAITPTSVNGVTLSGTSTPVLSITGTASVSGANTGDQTISITGDVTASGSVGALAATVTKINGTTLSGLSTGILKNTTGTGIPSIAIASDFPTLNQNTSGNAATVTTNANLTGVITSVGNTTSIASQTGTGSKFVVDTSPTLVTPTLGVASATSINKVTITAPATSATLTLVDGSSLITSGAFATTITSTATTNVTLPAGTSTLSKTSDIQVFTTTGANTWTKPTGAKSVWILCIGGGGGGGSGRKSATLTLATGGGGGGGAAGAAMMFDASVLTSTVSINVGVGGTGGASITANSTNGNAGGNGGQTTFGNYLQGQAGGGGGGGTSTAAAAGGINGTGMYNGAMGGASSATGGAGSTGLNPGAYTGSTGGGGGGITSVTAANAGGAGGVLNVLSGSSAATGGAVNTTGGNGTTFTWVGTGGGGGGGSTTTNAGAGGNGANYGSSGGGGGASNDSVGNSGAGGNGGQGICVVITHF